MISSCADCKTKCCKTGPGPYKTLKVREYLENFCYPDSYNTRCEHLSKSGKCKIWQTPEFPTECRTHVCQHRKYSKQELKDIDNTVDLSDYHKSFKCPCNSNYVIYISLRKAICECCGITFEWNRIFTKPTKKIRKKGMSKQPKSK